MRSLDARWKSAVALQHNAISLPTRAAYDRVRIDFAHFCHTALHVKAKLKTENILLYLEELHHCNKAPATLRSQLSSLAYFAKRAGRPDPTQDCRVRDLLKGCERQRGTVDTRRPFTLHILRRVLKYWEVRESRNYPLFASVTLTAFFAMLRISEVCASNLTITDRMLQRSQVDVTSDGMDVTLLAFKHNPSGQPHVIHISRRLADEQDLCPVRALERYLNTRPLLLSGPLYTCQDAPLTQSVMNKALKEAVGALKLNGRYTFHSLRIGGASWAAETGLDEGRIRRLGRWSSSAFTKYIRQASF